MQFWVLKYVLGIQDILLSLIHYQQDRKQEAERFRLHAEAQEHLEFFLQFSGRKICWRRSERNSGRRRNLKIKNPSNNSSTFGIYPNECRRSRIRRREKSQKPSAISRRQILRKQRSLLPGRTQEIKTKIQQIKMVICCGHFVLHLKFDNSIEMENNIRYEPKFVSAFLYTFPWMASVSGCCLSDNAIRMR